MNTPICDGVSVCGQEVSCRSLKSDITMVSGIPCPSPFGGDGMRGPAGMLSFPIQERDCCMAWGEGSERYLPLSFCALTGERF